MGRSRAIRPWHRPYRNGMASTPLASGGSMSFYEPDHLLSDQMGPKQTLPMELAIRETAWNYYRVLGFLPNPSETLRRLSKDIAEYKYLLEDSHVNGCMSSRKAGTCSMQWTLDRNNAPARAYQTVKSCFDTFPMYDIISEALNCVWFGYQPVEVVWEKAAGLVLPVKVEPKDPDWFRFSDVNELRYLTKRNMVTGEPVPQYKFLLARYRPSYERPYGRPLGSVCYWPCKMRHSGLRFLTTFCEKFGQPWIKASYPLGTQEARVAELVNMIDQTVQDGVVAYPSEWSVETVDVNKTASSEIFKTFIEMCNEEIAIGILGQTLTTNVSAKGGSYAASKTHGGIRKDIVDEDKRIIENLFNDLISWIWELNFGKTDSMPLFKLIPAPVPTVDDGQMAVHLTTAGVRFTKEYFQNRFNMLDTEFDMTEPKPIAGGAEPIGNADVRAAAHDTSDAAQDDSSYDSTLDAVKNLTRR